MVTLTVRNGRRNSADILRKKTHSTMPPRPRICFFILNRGWFIVLSYTEDYLRSYYKLSIFDQPVEYCWEVINNPLLSQILPLYSSLVNVRMSTRWILLNTALRPGWIKSRCHEPSFSRQVAPPAEDGRTYKFNKYLGRFGITAFRHTPRFWGIWWAPRRSLVEWHGLRHSKWPPKS